MKYTVGTIIQDIIKYQLDYKKEEIKFIEENPEEINGCGSKGGFKFPDTMWGVNVKTACCLHDARWGLSKGCADLLLANKKFKNDLTIICDKESANKFMKFIRRLRIAKYVNGVEVFGTEAYADERGIIGPK